MLDEGLATTFDIWIWRQWVDEAGGDSVGHIQ